MLHTQPFTIYSFFILVQSSGQDYQFLWVHPEVIRLKGLALLKLTANLLIYKNNWNLCKKNFFKGQDPRSSIMPNPLTDSFSLYFLFS
jgi:hypothetical protein